MQAPNMSRAGTIAYRGLLVAVLLALLLYVIGVFGTQPTDTALKPGRYSMASPTGSKIFDIEVQDDGHATIDYRGITMSGVLERLSATQQKVSFGLRDIETASVSDASELSLSIDMPSSGFAEWPYGTWCLEFSNDNTDGGSTDPMVQSALLGQRDAETESARYESKDAIPAELFDWVSVNEGGSARQLCKDFVPSFASDDALREAAHDLTWSQGEPGVVQLKD